MWLLLGLLSATWVWADYVGLTDAVVRSVAKKYGWQARERVLDWQALVEDLQRDSEAVKLERVNEFFNQVRFVPDDKHWGKKDYWATPLELLATDGGDCEDFSIAKYFTLLELGVPEDRLRITYVKALELKQAHMVLTYYKTPSSVPLVLDNLIDDIKKANKRKDLKPVYSFNGNGLWLSVSQGRGSGKRVGGSERISLWKDLTKRMETEASQ